VYHWSNCRCWSLQRIVQGCQLEPCWPPVVLVSQIFLTHLTQTSTNTATQLDHDHPHRRFDRWSHHGHHSQHPQFQLSRWKCSVDCGRIFDPGVKLGNVFHYVVMACFSGSIELFMMQEDILTTGICFNDQKQKSYALSLSHFLDEL
jgi:hypothetical protein